MDECSMDRDGSEVQLVPSDSQLLYWTLVDDGALPDGFLEDFIRLRNQWNQQRRVRQE